jgi:putative ABC transport system substrate-binding protein
MAGKRLEILKLVVPALSRVGVLWEAATGPYTSGSIARETEDAGQVLGVQIHPLEVRGPDDLENSFETGSSAGVEALIVAGSPLFVAHRAQVATLALEHHWPTIGTWGDAVRAGLLMSYGPPNLTGMFRRAATLVDKILKGASPAAIPVEQPMTFDFVVNMKTARELGITFPQEILLQITEVVE